MDLRTDKLELIQLLMNTQKKSVLDKVREVFVSSTNSPVVFDVKGNPLDKKSYRDEIDSIRSEVRKGNISSLEDLDQESENWS